MTIETFGLVLAGGQARRMGGGDKALIRIGGETILDRALARLTPHVSGIVLNANGDPARFAAWGLPVVADSVPDFAGPLAGILAGLDWAAANRPGIEWMVSVPGDCPFLPHDLVARLHAARAPRASRLPARIRATGDIRWSGYGRSRCARICGTPSRSRTCARSKYGPRATASRWPTGRTSRSIRSST